jgi:hypothetical protein
VCGPVNTKQAFEDDLPFEEFTVRVAEADIPQLPQILKGYMDHPDHPVAAKQVSNPVAACRIAKGARVCPPWGDRSPLLSRQ